MKRQKRRNSSNKIENLTQSILAILRKDHSNPHNYKQLASKLGVDDPSSRNQIIKKLKLLEVEKTIQEVDRGKYIITPSQNYYTGRVDMAGRGQGYIIVEDLEEDIYVKSKKRGKNVKQRCTLGKDKRTYDSYISSLVLFLIGYFYVRNRNEHVIISWLPTSLLYDCAGFALSFRNNSILDS